MALRWRRILPALAAGAGVMLVLFLLTLISEDRPLWGVNPDVQIWAAGVLAAVAGLVAYAGLQARSPKPMAVGAGLGVVGFGVVLLASMAFVAGFSGSAAYYQGWNVDTDFEEAWDASTARAALEDQGFNVTSSSEDGLRAHRGEDVRVTIDVDEPASSNASREAFTFQVVLEADGGRVGSVEEASQQAREDRPALEDRFDEILASFEASTGWTHVGDPVWEPRIAVT